MVINFSKNHNKRRGLINKKISRVLTPDISGAGDATRTHDLLITNQLHYRLCYTSMPYYFTITGLAMSTVSYEFFGFGI